MNPRSLIVVILVTLISFWGNHAPSSDIEVEKIYFYSVRGLALKEFLTKSLNLDEENGEFISLGLDPERDRAKEAGSSGSRYNPFVSPGSASNSERELYQKIGGFLIISAPIEKIAKAKKFIAQADALPPQIQIETFIVRIDREKLESREINVAAIVNAIQDIQEPLQEHPYSVW